MPYRSYREWKEPGLAAGSALPGLHGDMDDITLGWLDLPQMSLGLVLEHLGSRWVPVGPGAAGALRAEDAVGARDGAGGRLQTPCQPAARTGRTDPSEPTRSISCPAERQEWEVIFHLSKVRELRHFWEPP